MQDFRIILQPPAFQHFKTKLKPLAEMIAPLFARTLYQQIAVLSHITSDKRSGALLVEKTCDNPSRGVRQTFRLHQLWRCLIPRSFRVTLGILQQGAK
jgi:hypothetical protein